MHTSISVTVENTSKFGIGCCRRSKLSLFLGREKKSKGTRVTISGSNTHKIHACQPTDSSNRVSIVKEL